MSLLQAIKVKQNKDNAVNIGKIADPNKLQKHIDIIDNYENTVLVLNGIVTNDIEFKNKLLSKIFQTLSSVNSGKIWHELS